MVRPALVRAPLTIVAAWVMFVSINATVSSVKLANQPGVTVPHTREQTRSALSPEIDLLGDIDPVVRLRSAVELGRRHAAEAASALVERLGLEREFFIRETLTWAVLRIAGDTMPYLHQALSSPRWLARMQAMHVLARWAATKLPIGWFRWSVTRWTGPDSGQL